MALIYSMSLLYASFRTCRQMQSPSFRMCRVFHSPNAGRFCRKPAMCSVQRISAQHSHNENSLKIIISYFVGLQSFLLFLLLLLLYLYVRAVVVIVLLLYFSTLCLRLCDFFSLLFSPLSSTLKALIREP